MATGTIPATAVMLSTVGATSGGTITLSDDPEKYTFLAFNLNHYAYGSVITLVAAEKETIDFQLVGMANSTTLQVITMVGTRSGRTITLGDQYAVNVKSNGNQIFATQNLRVGLVWGIP